MQYPALIRQLVLVGAVARGFPARAASPILVGDADIPNVHAHADAIEAGIAGLRRVVITDAGHLVYLEKPEEFSRVVITFIDRNGP